MAPVDEGGTTLHELVAARRLSGRPALIDGSDGPAVGCAALVTGVERLAAGLHAGGFRPGDMLGLWAPNLPEWPLVALGAMAPAAR